MDERTKNNQWPGRHDSQHNDIQHNDTQLDNKNETKRESKCTIEHGIMLRVTIIPIMLIVIILIVIKLNVVAPMAAAFPGPVL
jgi:hypothetical protein